MNINFVYIVSSFAFLMASCSKTASENKIVIDGSSTVFPISEAVAEAAGKVEALKNLRVGVALSGTGGGFKKFCNAEIDITGASRPIKEVELERCAKNQVDFIEIPIAFDGIAVVVHPENDCVDELSVDQLKKIWEPEAQGKILSWKQIDSQCPDRKINLYGPGHDSGTFDFFTEAIVGEAKSSRADFTASEDDNVLVSGVAGDRDSLAYFGIAYYLENADKLKILPISTDSQAVFPNPKNISTRLYQPLSRPLYIYVSEKKLSESKAFKEFISFYLTSVHELVGSIGYVPLGQTFEEQSRISSLAVEFLEAGKIGPIMSQLSNDLSMEQKFKSQL